MNMRLSDHTDRKHRICNRVRSFANRNNRRPIADVLEVKVEDYIFTTIKAIQDRDEDVYRPLLSFSVFQQS